MDAAIHRRGETGVAAHRDHASATPAGRIRRTIGGPIVDDQHFGGGLRLRVQRIEQALQQITAVPNRHDRADTHRRKRFLARNAMLWKPSRHGLSLASPRREEYMMEISPKRIRGLRRASILIS